MSFSSWMETYATATGDGPSLSNSTTATSILPAQAKYTLPANFFAVGRALRLVATGRISNIVTGPVNLTLDVRFGSIIVANGGPMRLNAVAKTTVPWWLEWVMTCRAIGNGTTANLMSLGNFQSESVVGSPLPTAGGNGALLIPVGTPAVGSGFDSTATQTVDLFATFDVANAGNLIQLHSFVLMGLN
jgi:hypothetical protein